MSRGAEAFDGPDYLTRFDPDPDAMARLAEIDSETALRLRKLARREWPGSLSVEDYLGPLAQAGGDILLRVVDTPGSQWVWYRGSVFGDHAYLRFGALPHYQDHKIVSRRNSHPERLRDMFDDHGTPIPVHRENAPENIREFIDGCELSGQARGDTE